MFLNAAGFGSWHIGQVRALMRMTFRKLAAPSDCVGDETSASNTHDYQRHEFHRRRNGKFNLTFLLPK